MMENNMPKLQAHRGVSTECPENTYPAFLSAADQGYDVVELDVACTKDNAFVILHDDTLNRTARNLDGSPLDEKIYISDITYEQALAYDFGIGFSPKFAKTPICLLVEALNLARRYNIRIKIDNKYCRFDPQQKKLFFDLLKNFQDVACLTCPDLQSLYEASHVFDKMDFHYDGNVTSEILEDLSKILPRDRLTVWLPIKNRSTSWFKGNFADEKLAKQVKTIASLGIWIVSDYDELSVAQELCADIVETHGQVKPVKNCGIFADMHTHSHHSHDARYALKDMCDAEIKAGVRVMALTDHCDSFFCLNDPNFDMYSNQRAAFSEALELAPLVRDKCHILKGIELGDAVWVPTLANKVLDMLPYDVVIGSVHAVKDCPGTENSPNGTLAFSQIDWARLTDDEIAVFFDMYFDDVQRNVETMNMDIMAHLTNPKGYILHQKNMRFDVHLFEGKIRKILQTIIDRGIAMEITTRNLVSDGWFYPDNWIIKLYHEMGGYLITLSSDAHRPDDAGVNFVQSVKILYEFGFKNIFYLENRRFVQCTIDPDNF